MDNNLDTSELYDGDEAPFVPVEFPGSQQDAYTNPAKESLPAFFYQDHPQPQYTFPQTRSVAEFEPDKVGRPGFFENFKHSWKHANLTYQAGEYALTKTNSFDDDVPDGWRVTPEDLVGFDESYWYALMNATSPNALDSVKQDVRKEMKEGEYFSNGGWISSLTGSIVGGITDPTSYIGLKYLTAFKYATVPKTMIMNALKTAPAMYAHSFALESALEANKVAGTFEDAAFNALTDTVFASALIGVGSGVGKSFDNLKLYDAKKAFTLYTQKGVKMDPIFDPKTGKATGEVKISAAPGESLSAAETNLAETWWTERMEKSGAFAIPGVGTFLEKTMQIPGLQSPSAQAAFSKFTSVQKFFNGIAGSRYTTKGEAAGIGSEFSASNNALRYTKVAHDFNKFYSQQFMEANGISGDTAAAKLKSFAQGVSQNRQINHQQLGTEVMMILSDKTYKSEYSQAHALADEMHNIFNGMNELQAQHTGTKMFEDPRNAWKYFPIKDDTAQMVNRKPEYLKLTTDLYKDQDDRIRAIRQPKNDALKRFKELKELPLPKDKSNLLEHNNQIKLARSAYRKELETYNKRVINDPDYNILLEERNPLNLQERKELKRILKPYREAKTPDEKAEALAKIHDDAFEGKISSRFFTEEASKIKMLDPGKVPKLRRPFTSDREREFAALGLWESKMNMTPNDIMSSVFGQLSPSVSMPNYYKRRTNMLPVGEYVRAGFQDTNLPSLMAGYMQVVGRDLGFKEAFPEFARVKDFDGVLKGLKQEYKKAEDLITGRHYNEEGKVEYKNPDSPTRQKELAKLKNEFDEARKFMSNTFDAYFGINGSNMNPKLQDSITILRNITVSSLMGGVVAYQVAELGAMFLKNGLFKTFSVGARPLLKSFAETIKLAKGEELENLRNTAAHSALGLNTGLTGLSQKWFNPGVVKTAPGSNAWFYKAVNASNNLAHYSMNFYGVNFMANLNEKIAATVFQSRAMRACADHVAGTLSKKEREAMAHYGIDMDRHAVKFLDLMKEAGGYEDGRAMQSMYWKWSDNESMTRMGDSIRRAVQDVVVNTNAFDSPYWARDPLLSVVFMFHGWAYSAFNRYAVPWLQRPNVDNSLGIVAMVGLNMLSDPLLRLANGKDLFKDDEEWWHHVGRGVEYSGLLGPNYDAIASLNKFMGDPLWESSEKRSGYNRYGNILGPNIGLGIGVADSLTHAYKGDFTQGDARKITRAVPGLSHVGVRNGVNYFLENSGLPEKRSKHE